MKAVDPSASVRTSEQRCCGGAVIPSLHVGQASLARQKGSPTRGERAHRSTGPASQPGPCSGGMVVEVFAGEWAFRGR
jgi:hypothetical protein